MKKSALKIFAAIILLASGSITFAQSNEDRIRFAAGKSSATVSNSLSAGAVRTFVLYVKKGQIISAKVVSAGRVDLDGANISAGQFEEPGNKSFNVRIDQTGDYQVYVRNRGKTATRFTLTVTVL